VSLNKRVVSGLSLGYILGHRIGAPILDWLAKKKNIKPYIDKSNLLIERHGSYTIVISCFLPIVRHVVPYFVGLNRMTFLRYAMFSYTTGFVWILFYFIVGYTFQKMLNKLVTPFTNMVFIFYWQLGSFCYYVGKKISAIFNGINGNCGDLRKKNHRKQRITNSECHRS
jgi:membrane protein DedA with SNARE-associated domain